MTHDEDGNVMEDKEVIDTSPQVSIEVGVKKFFLRELLLFFREERKKVFGDSGFSFTINEFKKFLKENRRILRVMGPSVTNENIFQHLKLCENLLKRDINGKIVNPADPSPLLKINKVGGGERVKFNVKDCTTEDITNAIRDIDVALCVNYWSISSEEREEKSKESLFHETADFKIYFRDDPEKNCSPSLKEMSLFRTLHRLFREPCPAAFLYDQLQRAERLVDHSPVPLGERRDKIESGIAQLRQKLYELSGNPDTIRTSGGKVSEYTLIY